MHGGFINFMDRSVGTWSYSHGSTSVERLEGPALEAAMEELRSHHPEFGLDGTCYLVTWSYPNPKKKVGHTLMAVDQNIPGYVFHSGWDVVIPAAYQRFTQPMKLPYECEEESFVWRSEDRAFEERFTFEEQGSVRRRDLYLGNGSIHRVTLERIIR